MKCFAVVRAAGILFRILLVVSLISLWANAPAWATHVRTPELDRIAHMSEEENREIADNIFDAIAEEGSQSSDGSKSTAETEPQGGGGGDSDSWETAAWITGGVILAAAAGYLLYKAFRSDASPADQDQKSITRKKITSNLSVDVTPMVLDAAARPDYSSDEFNRQDLSSLSMSLCYEF